jgi:hypothetical protein
MVWVYKVLRINNFSHGQWDWDWKAESGWESVEEMIEAAKRKATEYHCRTPMYYEDPDAPRHPVRCMLLQYDIDHIANNREVLALTTEWGVTRRDNAQRARQWMTRNLLTPREVWRVVRGICHPDKYKTQEEMIAAIKAVAYKPRPEDSYVK